MRLILGCCLLLFWRTLSGQGLLPSWGELVTICSANDYQTLERILSQHSKDDIQVWLTTSFSNDDFPIHTCARCGCTNIMRLLLEYGADPNLACSDGTTPLWAATLHGHSAAVELLLDSGADPEQPLDASGQTPLHRASAMGYSSVVLKLLKTGSVSPLDIHRNSPLYYAANSGHPTIATLLMQSGADAALQNAMGDTAHDCFLSSTILPNDHYATRWLILQNLSRNRLHKQGELKASRPCEHRNEYGETTVHEAIRSGNAELGSNLVRDLETPRVDGCTPLHLAVLHRNVAALAVLVIQGVHLSPVSHQNETPLHLAIQDGYQPIINTLAPAMITAINAASRDSYGLSEISLSDQFLLSRLPVFSLQDTVANALRGWLNIDKLKVLFELGLLPPGLGITVLGSWYRSTR